MNLMSAACTIRVVIVLNVTVLGKAAVIGNPQALPPAGGQQPASNILIDQKVFLESMRRDTMLGMQS